MNVSTLPILRPLRLGQLLDQATRLYRRHFLQYVGIVATVQIPLSALQILVSWLNWRNLTRGGRVTTPYTPLGLLSTTLGTSSLLTVASFLLIQGVATALMTRAVADHYLGEPSKFLDTYRRIGRSWFPMIGALLLAAVLFLCLIVWWAVPCAGWITGLGMLLFYMLVVVPLIAPAIILEGQSVSGSIRRAWDLARRRFWWLFGFVGILYLFRQLIVAGPDTLATLILTFFAEDWLGSGDYNTVLTTQTIIQSLVGMLLTLIYLPLELTAKTLVYFDLRVRSEGLDLTLLAESTWRDPTQARAAIAQAPPPEGRRLVEWTEAGYFALFSVGVLGICGVLYGLLMAVFYLLVPLSF